MYKHYYICLNNRIFFSSNPKMCNVDDCSAALWCRVFVLALCVVASDDRIITIRSKSTRSERGDKTISRLRDALSDIIMSGACITRCCVRRRTYMYLASDSLAEGDVNSGPA